jgi:hypothetical protein
MERTELLCTSLSKPRPEKHKDDDSDNAKTASAKRSVRIDWRRRRRGRNGFDGKRARRGRFHGYNWRLHRHGRFLLALGSGISRLTLYARSHYFRICIRLNHIYLLIPDSN